MKRLNLTELEDQRWLSDQVRDAGTYYPSHWTSTPARLIPLSLG